MSTSENRTSGEALKLDHELLGYRPSAEVPRMFRHGGYPGSRGDLITDGRFLQQALRATARVRKLMAESDLPGNGPVKVKLAKPAFADVTELHPDDVVIWATNPRHKALVVQPSPFVIHNGSRTVESTTLTLHYVKGNLVRAHVGEPMPPMPWQNPLTFSKQESLDFWRTHAFLRAQARWDREGMWPSEAPDWAQ